MFKKFENNIKEVIVREGDIFMLGLLSIQSLFYLTGIAGENISIKLNAKTLSMNFKPLITAKVKNNYIKFYFLETRI